MYSSCPNIERCDRETLTFPCRSRKERHVSLLFFLGITTVSVLHFFSERVSPSSSTTSSYPLADSSLQERTEQTLMSSHQTDTRVSLVSFLRSRSSLSYWYSLVMSFPYHLQKRSSENPCSTLFESSDRHDVPLEIISWSSSSDHPFRLKVNESIFHPLRYHNIVCLDGEWKRDDVVSRVTVFSLTMTMVSLTQRHPVVIALSDGIILFPPLYYSRATRREEGERGWILWPTLIFSCFGLFFDGERKTDSCRLSNETGCLTFSERVSLILILMMSLFWWWTKWENKKSSPDSPLVSLRDL